jgi:hypothetical protein
MFDEWDLTTQMDTGTCDYLRIVYRSVNGGNKGDTSPHILGWGDVNVNRPPPSHLPNSGIFLENALVNQLTRQEYCEERP